MTSDSERSPLPTFKLFVGLASAVTLILLIAGANLLARDIYIQASDGERFCGSAYDVSFLKQDGYMGGELAPDQDAIDAECVRTSNPYAYAGLGAVAAAVLVASGTFGIIWRRRQLRAPPIVR